MYANLAVNIAPHGSSEYEQVSAYEVRIVGTRVVVMLDAQDGGGSYAEPAGERQVDLMTHHLSITADF